MFIEAWIGLFAFMLASLIPLLNKETKTNEEKRNFIITLIIILAIIIAVLVFQVNFFIAFLVGIIVKILLNKKTYTKKRLILYGVIVVVIGSAAYYIFRDNPDYVINHLKKHPESTSLYLRENGEELITYEANVVRPLASTVKILIAAEYARQVDEGILNKDSLVSLDELNKFYLKGTDGNAHENWLAEMDNAGKIDNNQVTLQEVAKGMIKHSSNANTDYLINLLGPDSINERAKSLSLHQHEEIYPLVSITLIPDYLENNGVDKDRLNDELNNMTMDRYKELVFEINEQIMNGNITLKEKTINAPSSSIQKIVSDRFIGASANDYGKLLAIISNDELPATQAEIMRDLMEWPMEINEGNRERFAHIGLKGGSTLFIINDAIYAEDHSGNKIEMVIFTDDLNFWQYFLLMHNFSSFESKMLNSKEYRQKVKEELAGL